MENKESLEDVLTDEDIMKAYKGQRDFLADRRGLLKNLLLNDQAKFHNNFAAPKSETFESPKVNNLPNAPMGEEPDSLNLGASPDNVITNSLKSRIQSETDPNRKNLLLRKLYEYQASSPGNSKIKGEGSGSGIDF